jgi:hypothetical protein
LQEYFTATRRELLFDPFCEEGEGEGEGEGDTARARVPFKSTIEINNEFKTLLLNREIDPFASWPSITEALKSDPAFFAVQSDKKRQELLAECCPQLIALKRVRREREIEEARQWFEEEQLKMKSKGVHWSDALRKMSGDERFSLLNVKECEKRYKSK